MHECNSIQAVNTYSRLCYQTKFRLTEIIKIEEILIQKSKKENH